MSRIMEETVSSDEPAQIPAEAVQQTGYEVVTPATYQENGTLPVYRVLENDFRQTLQPEWFNQSGIAEKTGNGDVILTFNDYAMLTYSAEAIWYAEHTDELFDYNWQERENGNPDIEPMLLPKEALSQGIADIASSVYDRLGDYTEGVTFEKDQLTLLSLESAEQTAQTLFDHLKNGNVPETRLKKISTSAKLL